MLRHSQHWHCRCSTAQWEPEQELPTGRSWEVQGVRGNPMGMLVMGRTLMDECRAYRG